MHDPLHALARPIDPRGFEAFRTGLGLLGAFAALRFVAKGWVEALYLAPTYHFAWFPWAVVPSGPVLYALYGLLVGTGLLVATSGRLGAFGARAYRPAVVLHLAAFVYLELLDATLYLNHYVLYTLLWAALAVAPAPGRPVRAWLRWGLQGLFATVWLWAGLCKLGPDWLLHGEPLTGWLQGHRGLPLVGPWLAHPTTGLLMSWGGAAYDLLIPFLLWTRRTRPLALLLALGFHLTVWALFPIGIFPWLMLLGLLPFLPEPGPLRAPREVPHDGHRLAPAAGLAWAAVLLALALVPSRPLWMSDDPHWTEEGFRFSWRVMRIEKSGMVDYTAVERTTGRRWRFRPGDELTDWQHEQMRTQPDLIRQYALHLADRMAAQGHDVAVHAEAWAQLHDDRRTHRLLRPDVDLTRPLAELRADGWILARPNPEEGNTFAGTTLRR